MTPAALRRELAQLEDQRGRLETRRLALTHAVDEAISAERFDPHASRAAKIDLDSVVERIAEVDERHAALTKRLPGPDAVRAAERDLAALQQVARETGAEFDSAAAAYLDALDIAEVAGVRLATARTAARLCRARMTDVATAGGLQLDAQIYPEIADRLVRVALLQAQLVGECSHGEPSDVVAKNLAAQRLVPA